MVNPTSSRVRSAIAATAGPLEVAAGAAIVVAVWRCTLGWNWSSVPTADQARVTAPQSGVDWLIFAVAVVSGTGWLALRGRAVAGTLSVCVPIVVLSGWRMAASDVLAWPISLASLIFSLCVMALIASGLGTWTRYTNARPDRP